MASNSRLLTSFNDVNSLEYGTLKILYEVLNKRFRYTQHQLRSINFRFGRGFQTFQAEIDRAAELGGEPLDEKAVEELKLLRDRLNEFGQEFRKCVEEEFSAAEKLNNHVELLKQSESPDPVARDFFKRQRIDRLIIDHLLRTGYFETAQKLAAYVGLDIESLKNVFHVAKQVEQSLAQHDLTECLKWVLEHASRLHRMRSNFETEVRIQECVELVKLGKTREALQYVRAHFGNRPGNQQIVCKCCKTTTLADWTDVNLQHLMGLVAIGTTSTRKEHQELMNLNRYKYLTEMFLAENARIYQISDQSPFGACLQAGIAVHKTPNCSQNGKVGCIVCEDVFELSEGLPVTHSATSRLFCKYSGEMFDEDENRPMMLPNGHVYGEKTIRALAENDKFKCPETLAVFNLNELKRVFVF